MLQGPFLNCNRGYGATVARLTPDQKVGSSNLSGLIWPTSLLRMPWREALFHHIFSSASKYAIKHQLRVKAARTYILHMHLYVLNSVADLFGVYCVVMFHKVPDPEAY
jgi:hypothetical protein